MVTVNPVKKNLVSFFVLLILSLSICKGSFAQAPNLVFAPLVTSGLSSPIDIAVTGDGTGRIFIVERIGRVRIYSGGALQPGYFLDIQDSVTTDGERGLLSIAFHPDFVNNGYFFIYYTDASGDIRITRFQTLGGNHLNAADESTGKVLMTIPHPVNSNHNGGKLNFGPDGNLYFGTGDGGGTGDPNNQAQNGNLLLGKMIRINVDNFTTPPYYTIPADNPYVNDPNVRDEIFALGLRNPFRWSFDKLNHDVWIADVGQSVLEEVNNVPFAAASNGTNYGWRCYEGTGAYNTSGCLPQNSYQSPIFTYGHNNSTGGFAITGGFVYRAAEYGALYGYYICCDYVSGNAWLIKPNGSGGWTVSMQAANTLPGSIVAFGENETGALFAVSLTGSFYKVTTNTAGPVPLTLLQFTAKAFAGYNELKWKTVNEQGLSYYDIEFSSDGTNYTTAGRVNAINTVTENNYSFQHFITGYTKLFYRIRITNKDGSANYSNIVILDNKERANARIYPTLIKDDHLNVVSEKPVDQVIFFSAEGKNVFQTRLNGISGTTSILLPRLPNGLYIVQLRIGDEYVNDKVLIQH